MKSVFEANGKRPKKNNKNLFVPFKVLDEDEQEARKQKRENGVLFQQYKELQKAGHWYAVSDIYHCFQIGRAHV